ncbi:uncharacterized protein STEHIDRAFT_167783 [Stereum hirsutum FP-91666 SS1]|uniref:uncharacterized protein n=1 Tax=Stereum hirsutum (strain FP-91666) TaxID=721885 RepID=UPI000440CECF|nr:uncharacterized protein STEHIDRAFT_167783 [Stereum hirsutum FP-91666 SS1]EIM88506.1 hypothetical protein STEHIDRAFT_167783 [Stereum hirsutum FP-91666 SS1]
MDDDYYSIESILSENQKIQCTFKIDIEGMGHLAGGDEKDIKQLTKMQLPLWMSCMIVTMDWADWHIPTPFSSRVRNALNAEAKSVRLSSLVGAGGLWYGFGRSLMEKMLQGAAAAEMSRILTKAFHSRLVEVIDQAQHFGALGPAGGSGQSGDSAQSFREGLDATEREMFALAQESAKRTKRWYETSDRATK